MATTVLILASMKSELNILHDTHLMNSMVLLVVSKQYRKIKTYHGIIDFVEI